jgi:Rha family phage regulatory protein
MEQAQVLKPRITLIGGRVMTTSLVIAKHFGNCHDSVLLAIRNALQEVPHEFGAHNFVETSYRNRSNRLKPMYRLTRDGFAYSAMSFTGKEAARWKVAYIETFNAMEARLRHAPGAVENFLVTEQYLDRRVVAGPIERGLPPLSAHPFLELYYALQRDYGSTILVTYLLSVEAHQRVLRASYREISKALDQALSRGGVRDSAIRLAAQQLLWHEPGQPLGEPGQFLLSLDALSQRLADSRMQRHVGLTDGEVGEPLLLH